MVDLRSVRSARRIRLPVRLPQDHHTTRPPFGYGKESGLPNSDLTSMCSMLSRRTLAPDLLYSFTEKSGRCVEKV
jgi:hypothetical protein